MKLPALIVGTVLAFGTISTAEAAEVNFSGSMVNMGAVDYGQYGVITDIYEAMFSIPPHQMGSGTAFGLLPTNATITFTYNFTGLREGSVQGYGAYDHILNGDHFEGNALASSEGFTYTEASVNGAASSPLVFASANMNVSGDPTTGTVIIRNISGSFAQFQALFCGILTQIPNAVGSINYVVSAIPLPAALPMFGTLLAAMFGFSRKRRKEALAAA